MSALVNTTSLLGYFLCQNGSRIVSTLFNSGTISSL